MAKRISSRQCGVPLHKGHPEVEGATLVPLILAGILFAIRMAAKIMGLGGGWGPDDYTIIVAEVGSCWIRWEYSSDVNRFWG